MIIVRYSIVCIWRARVKAAENVIAPGMIYHHVSTTSVLGSSPLVHQPADITALRVEAYI